MMGICLDTDVNPNQSTVENNDWQKLQQINNTHERNDFNTNLDVMEIHNVGKIKFDPPKVPVIFILGGPGSGKVTHCDTFIQERRGITHINMMDLLQQYAMGNEMQDFSQLSSKTVTEVLMLEMKMAPAAKAYLISGYPRSMRDVVEYSEKIQQVNGAILISWRESVLQKQIDYGAKLGHVVLSLAKMELENFFKNVMPVADYFDQSDMLIAVNGERSPVEVYKDFRAAVLDILNTLENQEAILNGITGMGKGINDIPGSIVSVDTAPSQIQTSDRVTAEIETISNKPEVQVVPNIASNIANTAGMAVGLNNISKQPLLNNRPGIPYVIWVIGGPGSNKAFLCHKAVTLNAGWAHFSVGRLLRDITDAAPRANTENYTVKEALSTGEMAPENTIQTILETNLKHFSDHTGIIIDGYPRNMHQVQYFENKYKQRPIMILLDCSKLQLGRGRIDDTVSSFRRRLELFREQTLPMLKFMDNNNRLQIIDGDTDSPSVQKEFEKAIRLNIKKLTNTLAETNLPTVTGMSSLIEAGSQTDAIVHDLEVNASGVVPTISHHISLMNGHLKNRQPSFVPMANGDIGEKNLDFRRMLQEAERHPVDSYI